MNMQQPVDGTLMVKNRFVREMLAAQSCLILHDPGINLGLPHCRQILYHLSHQGSLCLSEGGGAPLHPQPDL